MGAKIKDHKHFVDFQYRLAKGELTMKYLKLLKVRELYGYESIGPEEQTEILKYY